MSTISVDVEATKSMNTTELLEDLKTSIMVALTDTDRYNAYSNLRDAMVDISEIDTRLQRVDELEGRVETYRKWYHNEHEEVVKLKKQLAELSK